MRLSWAHAAAGALTAIVAAGLLAMPSRLLGPDQARLTPISQPRAASPSVVVAARPVVKPRVKVVRRAVQPAPTAQLASVVVHSVVPTRSAPVAHKAVRHPAHRAAPAHVTILNRVRRHPLPVDEPRVVAKPAPAPAPTPAPTPAPAPTPTPTPAPAPAATPAATPAAAPAPAPAPAPTPTPTSPTRVFAYTSTTATQTSSSGDQNCPHDDRHGNGSGNGHDNDYGHDDWNHGGHGGDGDQHGHGYGHGRK